MLDVDAELANALRSSQEGRTRAVASYQGSVVPITLDQSTGSVSFNGEAEVQSAGSVKVVGKGPTSLVPKLRTDVLATYGQELALWRDVILRDTTWSIPLGVYRITRAGDSAERTRRGSILDWSVRLNLSDRFEQVKADDFLAVDTPQVGGTVWSEVQRLSPIPVQQALGDVSVPVTTVYDTRLGSIETILELLGAVPALTRSGVLTARKSDAWLTEPTSAAVFDMSGTITWSDEMTNDFFNQVRVASSSDAAVVAYAQNSDPWDPLSVQRAGGRTFKVRSSTVRTVDEAQTEADLALRRLLTRRSRRVSVTCTPEALLLDLGDVGWMRDTRTDRAVFGEVARVGVSVNPTATVSVDLIVAEEA